LISLVAMLALAASPQAPDEASKAASIAPFVGEDVAVVVQVDLTRWQPSTSFRRVLGKLADDPDVAGVASAIDTRVAAMKKLGATDLFLLIDPADLPGYPAAVVPLAGGGDAKGVADVLTNGSGTPVRWPKAETIRGAVVAGSAEAIARVREVKSAPRPELLAALASVGDAPIRIAVIPSKAQRRAIEESFPTLPSQVGGEPIEVLTRGMTWASIAMTTEPKAMLRLAVRAKDGDSASHLRKVAQDALGVLAAASRSNPVMVDLADAVARMKPEVDGETVRLEADLEKTAALVSVPVLQAREASRRVQCTNNLKQIGLAMHNYLSTHGTFPAAFVAGKDGKPLLSWRVMILPFVEQEELYKQFHLDEPWDGPHNKALIARMPGVFACPSGSKALAAEGKTSYLTPRGPATVISGAVGIKIKDITDGSSNTILVVDASDDLAVTWTRPDDWSTAPEFTIQGLFGHHPNGTPFGMCDGSVRFFKQTISPKLLQALTTRNAGEVIDFD
jgi:hypothetical protein